MHKRKTGCAVRLNTQGLVKSRCDGSSFARYIYILVAEGLEHHRHGESLERVLNIYARIPDLPSTRLDTPSCSQLRVLLCFPSYSFLALIIRIVGPRADILGRFALGFSLLKLVWLRVGTSYRKN
jgi:hypothetical protein